MEDFQSSCRFCLKVCSEFAVNIFKDENGRSLAEEVHACLLDVKVIDLPLLPKIACLDCVESIMEVIRFRKRAIETYQTLQRELTKHAPLPSTSKRSVVASAPPINFDKSKTTNKSPSCQKALRMLRTEKLKWMAKTQSSAEIISSYSKKSKVKTTKIDGGEKSGEMFMDEDDMEGSPSAMESTVLPAVLGAQSAEASTEMKHEREDSQILEYSVNESEFEAIIQLEDSDDEAANISINTPTSSTSSTTTPQLALQAIRNEKQKWLTKSTSDPVDLLKYRSSRKLHSFWKKPKADAETIAECLEHNSSPSRNDSMQEVAEDADSATLPVINSAEELKLDQDLIVVDQTTCELQLDAQDWDIIEFVENTGDGDEIIAEEVETISDESPRDDDGTAENSAGTSKPSVSKKPEKHFSRVRHMPKAPLTEEEQRLEEVMMEMKLFECRVCGKDTQSLPELNQHVKNEHGLTKKSSYYVCCKISAPATPTGLYDHIRLHLDRDAFKCKDCEYRGNNSSTLKNHRLSTHATIPAKCYCHVCGEGFREVGLLSIHVKKHEDSTVRCEFCNNYYKSAKHLKLHIMQRHEKVTNYLCDLCGRGFPTSSQLASHVNDHGGPHGGRRRKKPKVQDVASSTLPYDESYFKG